MKQRSGFYPALKVDTRKVAAVGQGGGELLVETVAVAGLDAVLSQSLARWRKPLAVHDPAKVVTDLALSLAVGGDCLADIALLRAEPGVYGPVASDPTVSPTIDVLAADATAALKAINTARAAARARVWALAGKHAPDTGYRARRSGDTSAGHRAGEGLPSSRRHDLNVPRPIRRGVLRGCAPGSTPLPWPSP